MSKLLSLWNQYVAWQLPMIRPRNIVEILILAVGLYYIATWIRQTKAFSLLKGILILFVLVVLCYLFNLTTITFLLEKVLSVGIIALVIIFQPELRKALEQVGRQSVFSKFFVIDDGKEKEHRFSTHTVEAIVKASFELGAAKTGALIVIEQEDNLKEYVDTGITLDSEISSQLLVQIFEHNTPLHDGAVIIRGDRIVAATCYLPLSGNMEISKELGTRHRAAVGISEVTDSLTIIASEETGAVSLAVGGELIRDIDSESLHSKLRYMQRKNIDVKRFRLWKKGGSEKQI